MKKIGNNCNKFNPSGDYEDNPYYKGFIDGCIDPDNDKELVGELLIVLPQL